MGTSDALKIHAPSESPINDAEKVDAIGRMTKNLEDIKAFYTWSQKQAKSSFFLAKAMCYLGFALMVIAILLPLLFGLDLQASIISAIGGAITELIAGTTLFVYQKSLTQLNYYHKALHEDERFLSSVNLVAKFDTAEMQGEMLKEIIRSELQMNLAGTNNNTSSSVKLDQATTNL